MRSFSALISILFYFCIQQIDQLPHCGVVAAPLLLRRCCCSVVTPPLFLRRCRCSVCSRRRCFCAVVSVSFSLRRCRCAVFAAPFSPRRFRFAVFAAPFSLRRFRCAVFAVPVSPRCFRGAGKTTANVIAAGIQRVSDRTDLFFCQVRYLQLVQYGFSPGNKQES